MSDDNKSKKQTWRTTREEREERRQKVFELRTRRLSLRAIANVLGVSVGTVRDDLEKIKALHRKAIEKYDVCAELGKAIEQLDIVASEALGDAAAAETGSQAKVSALNTALRAYDQKHRLLVDVDLLKNPDIAERDKPMKIDITIRHPDETDEEWES